MSVPYAASPRYRDGEVPAHLVPPELQDWRSHDRALPPGAARIRCRPVLLTPAGQVLAMARAIIAQGQRRLPVTVADLERLGFPRPLVLHLATAATGLAHSLAPALATGD